MSHLRFRAYLDDMGLGYTLDHTVTSVLVKGDQRGLISRYGEQQAQAAWAWLLDATAGAGFEERVLSAVTVRDAWCQILNWTGPSSEAETLFLESQLETVPNYGDEDPKLFFSRVDQLLTRLRSVNAHKTEQQIVHILVRNLSDHIYIYIYIYIYMRSRSAPGSTLLFSGAKTWSISSAPPGPPARCASSNSDRHQG